MGVAARLIRNDSAARSLADPVRRRLLASLTEPGSASSVARQTGLKRQTVNYHLRELEQEGLVSEVGQQKKGNCVERLVQATAATYLISPEILGPLATDPANIRDTMSWAYLVALASRTIRELAILRERADAVGKGLQTLSLHADVPFASQADLNAFSEELGNTLTRLTAKYANPSPPPLASGSRLFRVTIGAYPAVTKTEDEARAEAAGVQDLEKEKPMTAAAPASKPAAEKRTAELSMDLKATPEAVWKALTDAEELTRWFPLEAKVKPGVGGSIFSSWGPGIQWDSPIAIWEPKKRLRVLWCPANTPEPDLFGVDYFIEDKGGGVTRLRLVHFGFSKDAAWDQMYDGVSRGWDFMFWMLRTYLHEHAGTPRRAFMLNRKLSVPRAEAWTKTFSAGGVVEGVDVHALKPGQRFEATVGGRKTSGTVRVNLDGKDFQAMLDMEGGTLMRVQTDPCKGGPGEEISVTLAAYSRDERVLEAVRAECEGRMARMLGERKAT